MRRYAVGWFDLRPDGEWASDAVPAADRITVVEAERGWRQTGLVDKAGRPIMVSDRMDQIGFVRR